MPGNLQLLSAGDSDLQQGEITRIIPHRATGRADYFGPPVNRAARFLAASAPGQVLAERTLVEECVDVWSADDLVSAVLNAINSMGWAQLSLVVVGPARKAWASTSAHVSFTCGVARCTISTDPLKSTALHPTAS